MTPEIVLTAIAAVTGGGLLGSWLKARIEGEAETLPFRKRLLSAPGVTAMALLATAVLLLLGLAWRDVLDVLGVVATVVAAILAWQAIRNADEQAQRSAALVRQERRLDFELDKLEVMWNIVRDVAGEFPFTVKQLMRFMPHAEFPRLSAQCRYEDAPEWAVRELERLEVERRTPGFTNAIFAYLTDDGQEYRGALMQEIEQAIERRVAAREDG